MYDLEVNPTLAQIVARSATLHPSTLLEVLRAEEAEYRAFALRGDLSREAQDAILTRADHYALAARAVELFNDGDRDALSLIGLGPLTIAAGIAAEFQGLPFHVVVGAAIRADEECA